MPQLADGGLNACVALGDAVDARDCELALDQV
jgi:hypothetical protein